MNNIGRGLGNFIPGFNGSSRPGGSSLNNIANAFGLSGQQSGGAPSNGQFASTSAMQIQPSPALHAVVQFLAVPGSPGYPDRIAAAADALRGVSLPASHPFHAQATQIQNAMYMSSPQHTGDAWRYLVQETSKYNYPPLVAVRALLLHMPRLIDASTNSVPPIFGSEIAQLANMESRLRPSEAVQAIQAEIDVVPQAPTPAMRVQMMRGTIDAIKRLNGTMLDTNRQRDRAGRELPSEYDTFQQNKKNALLSLIHQLDSLPDYQETPVRVNRFDIAGPGARTVRAGVKEWTELSYVVAQGNFDPSSKAELLKELLQRCGYAYGGNDEGGRALDALNGLLEQLEPNQKLLPMAAMVFAAGRFQIDHKGAVSPAISAIIVKSAIQVLHELPTDDDKADMLAVIGQSLSGLPLNEMKSTWAAGVHEISKLDPDLRAQPLREFAAHMMFASTVDASRGKEEAKAVPATEFMVLCKRLDRATQLELRDIMVGAAAQLSNETAQEGFRRYVHAQLPSPMNPIKSELRQIADPGARHDKFLEDYNVANQLPVSDDDSVNTRLNRLWCLADSMESLTSESRQALWWPMLKSVRDLGAAVIAATNDEPGRGFQVDSTTEVMASLARYLPEMLAAAGVDQPYGGAGNHAIGQINNAFYRTVGSFGVESRRAISLSAKASCVTLKDPQQRLAASDNIDRNIKMTPDEDGIPPSFAQP